MQLELRDLSSGLKTTERYRTTESVERVFIEDREFTYLYTEGDLITFMDVENYEQLSVPAEVVGEQAVWLQDGMKVDIAIYEGKALAEIGRSSCRGKGGGFVSSSVVGR